MVETKVTIFTSKYCTPQRYPGDVADVAYIGRDKAVLLSLSKCASDGCLRDPEGDAGRCVHMHIPAFPTRLLTYYQYYYDC